MTNPESSRQPKNTAEENNLSGNISPFAILVWLYNSSSDELLKQFSENMAHTKRGGVI